MKIIRTSEGLLSMLDESGKVREPVMIAEGCDLYGLENVTSLKGVILAKGCSLFGLWNITSLEGVTLAEGCDLYGLENVTSLKGVKFAEGCSLLDLTGITSLEGVTLAKGCELFDLKNVTSLKGVTFAEGCRLIGLHKVTSLDGVTLAEGCELHGLENLTSLDGLTLAKGCKLYGLSPELQKEFDRRMAEIEAQEELDRKKDSSPPALKAETEAKAKTDDIAATIAEIARATGPGVKRKARVVAPEEVVQDLLPEASESSATIDPPLPPPEYVLRAEKSNLKAKSMLYYMNDEQAPTFVGNEDGMRFVKKVPTDLEIIAMLETARKEYGEFELVGNKEFMERAAVIAGRYGIPIANEDLQEVYARGVAERKVAEPEAAPAPTV